MPGKCSDLNPLRQSFTQNLYGEMEFEVISLGAPCVIFGWRNVLLLSFLFVMLGLELRALCKPGKH